MGDSNEVAIRAVVLTAADGTELPGEIAVPEPCRAGAVICHPHPQLGGNRHNAVVAALFDALPAAGVAALRFDFRRDHGGGVAEIEDAHAALDALATAAPDVPLIAAGYSFGAAIALALLDDRIAGKVLIAPPLAGGGRPPGAPTLVLTPAGDQFCPPEVARPVVADWPDTVLRVIDAADHFLAGRTPAVTDETMSWIDQLLG